MLPLRKAEQSQALATRHLPTAAAPRDSQIQSGGKGGWLWLTGESTIIPQHPTDCPLRNRVFQGPSVQRRDMRGAQGKPLGLGTQSSYKTPTEAPSCCMTSGANTQDSKTDTGRTTQALRVMSNILTSGNLQPRTPRPWGLQSTQLTLS